MTNRAVLDARAAALFPQRHGFRRAWETLQRTLPPGAAVIGEATALTVLYLGAPMMIVEDTGVTLCSLSDEGMGTLLNTLESALAPA